MSNYNDNEDPEFFVEYISKRINERKEKLKHLKETGHLLSPSLKTSVTDEVKDYKNDECTNEVFVNEPANNVNEEINKENIELAENSNYDIARFDFVKSPVKTPKLNRKTRFNDILDRVNDEELVIKKPTSASSTSSSSSSNRSVNNHLKTFASNKSIDVFKTNSPKSGEKKETPKITPTMATIKPFIKDAIFKEPKQVKPKLLEDFFNKVKEQEIETKNVKSFAQTVEMFNNLSKENKSTAIDPSELPLAARRALFERKMKGLSCDSYVPSTTVSSISSTSSSVHETRNELNSKNLNENTPNSENSSGSSKGSTKRKIDNADEEYFEENEDSYYEQADDLSQILNPKNVDSSEENNEESSALKAFDFINNLSTSSIMKNVSYMKEDFNCSMKQDTEVDKVNKEDEENPSRLYPDLKSFKEEDESFAGTSFNHSSPNIEEQKSELKCSSKSSLNLIAINKQMSPIKEELTKANLQINDPVECPLIYRTISMFRKEQREIKQRNKLNKEPNGKDLIDQENNELKAQMIELSKQRINNLYASIDTLQNVIIQTSNALGLIRNGGDFLNTKPHIEAEKLLLITSQKSIECGFEIQRLKRQIETNTFNLEAATVKLNIAKITLKVKGDFVVSQVLQSTDKYDHYFICILHNSGQVQASELFSTVNGLPNACIEFNDCSFVFDDLQSDLSIKFEVYGISLLKTNHKKSGKKFNFNKFSLTPTKSKQKKYDNLFDCSSPIGLKKKILSSSFTRLGVTYLTIANLFRKEIVLDDFAYESPLSGFFELKINTSIDYNITMRSYLDFFEQSSFGEFFIWKKRWCVLKGYLIAYWNFERDEEKKESLGVIDLRDCINPHFDELPYDSMCKKNVFFLITVNKKQEDNEQVLSPVKPKGYKTLTTKSHIISCEDKVDFDFWNYKLTETMKAIRTWEPHSLKPLEASEFKALRDKEF